MPPLLQPRDRGWSYRAASYLSLGTWETRSSALGSANSPCSSENSSSPSFHVEAAVVPVMQDCHGYRGQDYSAGTARAVVGTFLSSSGKLGVAPREVFDTLRLSS